MWNSLNSSFRRLQFGCFSFIHWAALLLQTWCSFSGGTITLVKIVLLMNIRLSLGEYSAYYLFIFCFVCLFVLFRRIWSNAETKLWRASWNGGGDVSTVQVSSPLFWSGAHAQFILLLLVRTKVTPIVNKSSKNGRYQGRLLSSARSQRTSYAVNMVLYTTGWLIQLNFAIRNGLLTDARGTKKIQKQISVFANEWCIKTFQFLSKSFQQNQIIIGSNLNSIAPMRKWWNN